MTSAPPPADLPPLVEPGPPADRGTKTPPKPREPTTGTGTLRRTIRDAEIVRVETVRLDDWLRMGGR